jgi:hypothetical protein
MTIHSELPNDNYKPVISKPSLQQYDNYQINNIFSIDIVYTPLPQAPNIAPPPPQVRKSFLAVEMVSPVGMIDCDFNHIANTYK